MPASAAPGATARYSLHSCAACSYCCMFARASASSRKSGRLKGSVARRYLGSQQQTRQQQQQTSMSVQDDVSTRRSQGSHQPLASHTAAALPCSCLHEST
jgi:hypothetical protein